MFSIFKQKPKRYLRFLIQDTIQEARILEESVLCFQITVWEPGHYSRSFWFDGSKKTFWVLKTAPRIIDIDSEQPNNVIKLKQIA